MKLLSSLLSPYVRKVRIAAAMKGLSDRIELVAIDTNVPDNPAINRANPLAKVPALLVDGLAIYDSHVICEYLDAAAPAPVLFPTDAAARRRARIAQLRVQQAVVEAGGVGERGALGAEAAEIRGVRLVAADAGDAAVRGLDDDAAAGAAIAAGGSGFRFHVCVAPGRATATDMPH